MVGSLGEMQTSTVDHVTATCPSLLDAILRRMKCANASMFHTTAVGDGQEAEFADVLKQLYLDIIKFGAGDDIAGASGGDDTSASGTGGDNTSASGTGGDDADVDNSTWSSGQRTGRRRWRRH
eukprot:TRINITY_DN9250_c0_g1_i1.p2 TRINITY_DN9250_c0_g1~~TRINITY_DN9250_c0_g1_i1.p2  ORF type:complete len:123 (-),score=35.67 TRINITY_DN9250_c0_g1_i1:555-923(-)